MAASLLSSGAELQFGDLTSSNLNEPMQAMPSTTASTASPLRNRKVFVGLTVAAVAATTAVVIAKPDLTSVFAFLMEHWVGLFTAIGSIAQATLVVGLWQAKKQYQLGVEQANQTLRLSKISARRDAICLAAELCNHFGKDLTDQISKLEQIFAHGKSPVLSRAKVTTSDGIINLDLGAMTDVDRQFCKKTQEKLPSC